MTKTKKKIYSLFLGVLAFFALMLGLVFSTPSRKASAETTVDVAETMEIGDAAKYGDYKYAHMIRFQFPANGVSWGKGKCLNDGYPDLLRYIMINGESIYDRRSEYAALIQSGVASPITWEGYPDNGATYPYNMQPNIRNDVIDGDATYAPIFASVTYHSSLYSNTGGNAIDIYIPGSYLANTDVVSFGISKDFQWTAEDGTVYYLSKDVEYVKSGSSFVKVISTVDITDTLTFYNGGTSEATDTYYIYTKGGQKWTAAYGSTGSTALGEYEWKGQSDASKQGGSVQMSFMYINGQSVYDINATDNEAYGSTHSNISSGTAKFAPIMAWVVPYNSTLGGSAITIQIPSAYPGNKTTITIKKGFYVVDTSTNIKYEVTKDVQWDYENGTWVEHVEKIGTSISAVADQDGFLILSLTENDYSLAPSTWWGPNGSEAKEVLNAMKALDFHVYDADDNEISLGGDAIINIWGRTGDLAFYLSGYNANIGMPTKVTFKKGCQFPAYANVALGEKICYELTEDVTFVKDSSGNWVLDEGLKAGEYNTRIKSVVYARNDKDNWLMLTLSGKDYPKATEIYNVAATEEQMSVLNLYDKIVVDGYTLRSRIAQHGNPIEAPKLNLWQADCLGIRVPGASGTLDGAQRVTIRAGAQFPSYAYITEGVEAYYVTTEEITYVNVGNAEGNWERQYTATFVADGGVVATKSYVVSQGLTDIPEVPEKEGYRGSWEVYTANGNITINAVYTKKATVLGSTSIKEMRRIDNTSNLLIINPTNSDYPESVEGSWNLGLDVSHLQKFNTLDYITINGKTLRELGVSSMAINKFTRAGLGLETSLSNSMTIVIKKGCEIPSYAFWQSPDGEASAYVMDADYTCVYAAGGEAAFTFTADNVDVVTPDVFSDADEYVLSDLFNAANTKSYVFEDGIETLSNTDGQDTEEDYRYGYMGSTNFLLSFDFKYTGANFYETFNVQLGTEGYEGNKAHFGWRFYLLRGDATNGVVSNICVEYFSNTSSYGGNITGSADKTLGTLPFVEGEIYHITIGYKLVDAATGKVSVYTAVNSFWRIDEYTLGGDFVMFAPYANSLTISTLSAGTVTVSNPNMDMTNIAPNRITLKDGDTILESVPTASYVLPALNPSEYNKGGSVFVGWTTDLSTFENFYPAGYEYAVESDVTFYSVWIGFSMRDGAGVRLNNGSGLRFLVDVDKATYEAGVEAGMITGIGTIIAPTSYLTGRELSHELGANYYFEIPTAQWQVENVWYSAALKNISVDQYARSFSARGYMQIQYTSGAGYIYTEYNEAEHARSIYQVANMAYADYNEGSNERNTLSGYVDAIADITIDSSLNVSKTSGAKGSYTVEQSGADITISEGSVKAVMVNGVRIMMGYDATIIINGVSYTLSDYKLNSDGLSFTFTLEQIGDDAEASREAYYLALLQTYLDSDAYTKEHKAFVATTAGDAINAIKNDENDWETIVEEALSKLATIKTAAQLAANNTSAAALATPVLSKGAGYTVTWTEVENADYYIVYDNNDYRPYTVVMANETLTYKAEVIGEHSVTVTAHSYYEAYNSATSNTVATPKVKPVFSYKSMLDGLYKFSSSQMSTMGISTNGCYYDSSDKKYFVYYNKDIGWSPYPSQATDWTSPAEFPAHAQRLKDMGNNVILLAYDTNGAYKAEDKWASSRMKYIMDTAWSMGMKVLVCDEVFYDLSMSDNSGTGATSKAQVTAAINARAGFADYVTHPAFYGFSLDDEPYAKYISAMSYTISALDEACKGLGVSDPFYLACLFQAEGGKWQNMFDGELYYGDEDDLEAYWNKWLAIDGVYGEYLYVDIYTQHAMDQPTNRYDKSFNVVYNDKYLGGKYDFYQAITAHTQGDGVLLPQDMYMSLLYAAAHDVAGYSWFCYFPITGEANGCIGGYDGEGYGNGIGNGANSEIDYYAAAKTAAYQFELIQGWLDGYVWQTRSHSDSENLLTTTLSNGTNTATMYVNADVDGMSGSVTVTAMSGKTCYLVGYGIDTYQIVNADSSVTLVPGQALLCI